VVTAAAPAIRHAEALSAYATTVAAALPPCPGRLSTAVSALSWIELRVQHLAARDGRQDALLCPRAGGGFVIVVDPDLSPADRVAGRDAPGAMDWRIAHELGHTFFYDRGRSPRRWSSWRPEEEDAADHFAALLLGELSIPV
jgi:hypothetical protein